MRASANTSTPGQSVLLSGQKERMAFCHRQIYKFFLVSVRQAEALEFKRTRRRVDSV